MEIVIVDDDASSRCLLSKYLIKMGHVPIEAQNGVQALAIIEAKPIHFVVTDWMMPQMDGLSLCSRIRQTNYGRYIYLIMVTARDRKNDLLAVFEAGADDYISKPLDFEELKARIKTGLRLIELETHHLQMQYSLVQSRNKLRVVFDALEEKIVSLNPQMQIVSVNNACSKAAAIDAKEMIDRPFRDFFHIDIEKSAHLAFESGKRQGLLLKQRKPESTSYDQVFCVPVFDAMKQVVNTVVVIKDVTTDRCKTEEIESLNQRLMAVSVQVEAKNIKLEKTLKRLEETQAHMIQSEKMASIGQLAAGVAHEINNPTGFVSSNLKTLSDYRTDLSGLIVKYQELRDHLQTNALCVPENGELDARIQDIVQYEQTIDIDFLLTDITALIDDCREGTERIKKIVLDLKDFAHPGNEEQQLVDINRNLESTLNVVHNEIKYKATVQRSFGDIPMVLAFPQQLNQVFMNILVNAAQAIEKEGRIDIVTHAQNDCIEVRIGDTGCGIPPENLTKIFDPFFTTKEVGKGTGLGMHIAYNIIQKHRGTIGVESKVGQGTTFTIRLPAENQIKETAP